MTALPDLISALDSAVGRARGSTGARRKALLPYVLSHGTALADERDQLAERLERGWQWLGCHPDEAETDRWLGLLANYTAACDSLQRAERVI
jgi:hypothetical protein